MTIQQCKYAIEISKRGSFSEAAKHLFVAQSSLSGSIKTLEEELKITIFERGTNGVFLTNEGAEFIRYATGLVSQHEHIIGKYASADKCQKLYVSTQHYDFIADIFCKIIRETKESTYSFSLRETHTYNVISEIENARSDIGILAIKSADDGVMKRYLFNKGIEFNPFLKVLPHVFLRKDHPMASQKMLSYEKLKDFPFVSYEQGEHNNSFFTEEITTAFTDKHIEISDRASLMNVLLSTDCYTVGTGIMPSALNGGNIVSVPLESEEFYNIGYILLENRQKKKITEEFIKRLAELGR